MASFVRGEAGQVSFCVTMKEGGLTRWVEVQSESVEFDAF